MYILDKYAPKRLSEHVCQEYKLIEKWYVDGHKKPLLIVGSVGLGKSTLVRLLAEEYNLSLYELTPSDIRDKDAIERESFVVSKSQSIFGKKNLLFFDDVDVFFGDDKGGIDAILNVAKESVNPVIFVATDIYKNKKNQKFKDISEIISLKKPNYLSIFKILKQICVEEKIVFDELALKKIAQNCNGDIRSAIMDLDYLRPMGINDKTLLYVGARERKEDVFKTLLGLFKSKSLKEAIQIRDSSDIDYDMLFSWVAENIHLFYNSDKLKVAYNLLSIGDINRARIYVRQNWTFLKYYLLLGIIAPAIFDKKDNFTYKISFPYFMRFVAKDVGKYAKYKKSAMLLKKIMHGSKTKIISDMEYYKIIFSNNDLFNELKNKLNDDEQEFIVDFFNLPKSFIVNVDDIVKSNIKPKITNKTKNVGNKSVLNNTVVVNETNKNKKNDSNVKELILPETHKENKQKSLTNFFLNKNNN